MSPASFQNTVNLSDIAGAQVGSEEMEINLKKPLDLTAIRARLAGARGPEYWRSLEEIAETDEFKQFVEDEFPDRSSLLQLDRRDFLKFMGASLALAGLTGCRFLPQDKIVPYVKAPEELVPGKPLMYATAMPYAGYGVGLLVESHLGRPTKIEGNPLHPANRGATGENLGATDAIMQASLLDLYDPERSQNVTLNGQINTWQAFLEDARQMLEKLRATKGEGLRILTETVTSPTLADQIGALLRQFPAAKWHHYDAISRDNARIGARAAFGQEINTVYHFDKADVILSLDADFLLGNPASVRYARDFIDRRRVNSTQAEMNRLYVVESTPSLTGASADHRLGLRASQIEGLAIAIARAIGVDVGATYSSVPVGVPEKWVSAVARDLQSHAGRSLVLAGDYQPPAIHALAHAMNSTLGNVGKTITYTDLVEAHRGDDLASLQELVADMQAGKVQMLLILGGNPVFTAPPDLQFAESLKKVPLHAHLGLYQDETAAACKWHIPQTHYLESWSDVRAYDGTVSIIQPLIQPLYDGKSAHDLLAALLGQPLPGYDIVREHWLRVGTLADFDRSWRQVLHDGVMPGTTLPAKQVALRPDWHTASGLGKAAMQQGIEVNFRPDPTIWDGRYANNGWLQELPKPLTKLTWDNAALISPKLAQELGKQANRKVENGNLVELTLGGRKVKAPIWMMPGHPEDSVTLHLGYGRRKVGQIGAGTGFDANPLRSSEALWHASGLSIRLLDGNYLLVSTQHQNAMEGRNVILAGTLAEFNEKGGKLEFEHAHGQHEEISLYNEEDHKYDGYQWAMSIDLTACIGCNACVIACQAENNIPIVGKDQVKRGRAMHWIRIDRYYKGNDVDHPEDTLLQPVTCMHCELAPCEPVCPVAATTHSHEGLNQMVYNRCVGTRYCSNNCPYKVRRFNFYKYTAGQPHRAPGNYDNPTFRLMANPDVTIRGRGVMEKCTYCVQRINEARVEAKKDNRDIRDGEVVTACQQACPTKAIWFGNIADPNSQVSKQRNLPHRYSLLEELNTRPRTTYLARLRNPNPELSAE